MSVLKRSLSSSGQFGDVVFAKVVLLGLINVGKTSLATRIHSSTFRDRSKKTICVDYLCIKLDKADYENPVVLQLWDTAGQERYGSLVALYVRSAHTAIIVYDVTNKSSLYLVPDWVADVRKVEPKVHCVIVGNKMDDVENRQITYKEGKTYADNLDCSFYETSAKTGENVETMFDDIGREVSRTLTSQLARTRGSMRIEDGTPRDGTPVRRWCCRST